MDVVCIAYKNYFLIEEQVKHWHSYMEGDFNLIFVDATPDYAYKPFEYQGKVIPRVPGCNVEQFDGISSGLSYDYAISLCTSEVIVLTDPDHFFFQKNILEEIQVHYELEGYVNIGCSGTYPDFQSNIDTNYPDFAGHKAPVLWGMAIDRKLAASHSFICEPPGFGLISGWRVRKHIIDNNLPNLVWEGWYPAEDDNQVVFFGSKDRPKSMHLLKGCSSRAHLMPQVVPKYMEIGKALWEKNNGN